MPPLHLNQLLSRQLPHLLSRQDAPDFDDSRGDETDNLSGGAIAGIVIGSIAGLLLLIWIIRSCTNLGAPPGREADPGKPWYGGVRDEYPPRHVGGHRPHSASRHSRRSRSRSAHSHGHRHSHHRHSRSRSRGATMVEVPAPAAYAGSGRRVSREDYVVYDRDEVRRSRSRGRY
ncbi:hypothetical protein QBC42DRAFT_315604 [Cladorrhinum samala]|uniref:Uncharacterized protein n=1 Tax=Cladorrhinum samala TaxID=585594 RepID=A0AAV9HDD8_9PEZI|nr:hypothetical protein QBC42DRAFT_315604 [Cladorrhinum samala]